MGTYWKLVAATAAREAFDAVIEHWVTYSVTAIAAFASVGGVFYLRSSDAGWDELVSALWGLSAIIVMFAVVFLAKLVSVPPRLHDSIWVENLNLREKLPGKGGAPSGPDWTIRELFFHLDPRASDVPYGYAVGQVVLDSLSVGRLTCWGRIDEKDWADEIFESVSPYPLQEIERAYWRDATFTYAFLAEDGKHSIHAEPDPYSNGPSFKDLRVNKAQALSLDWSEIEELNQPKRDATLVE